MYSFEESVRRTCTVTLVGPGGSHAVDRSMVKVWLMFGSYAGDITASACYCAVICEVDGSCSVASSRLV